MTVFVDTSGLVAVLDADEKRHAKAAAAWKRLLDEEATLVTTNYVLVEAIALVQRRLGLGAVRGLDGAILPLLDVRYLDEEVHRASVAALLVAARRQLSLVDVSSFEVMRRLGLTTALALDGDFDDQGFETLP